MRQTSRRAGFTRTNSKGSLGGFTIIELMIATIIFALVLTVLMAAFLQVGRMFYKGVSYANTNESARTVTEDIASDIHFSEAVSVPCPTPSGSSCPYDDGNPDTSIYYFCLGTHRYTYGLFQKVTSADIDNDRALTGIQKASVSNGSCPPPCPPTGNCDPPSQLGTNTRQILGPDMQLNRFNFSCALDRCNIDLHIIFYGVDSEVFTSAAFPDDPIRSLREPDAYCSGGLISSQFCAISDLQTTILFRD